MKTLEVWNDGDGKIVYKELLENIEELEILEGNTLSVVLKNGFVKLWYLIEDGFNYSFKVA